MKVLVTGAAGRIGQAVVREFVDKGHSVRALDRRPLPADLRREAVQACYEDIGDSLAMMRAAEGCDTIVHLAAYPGPHGRTAADMLHVNVIGTQHILEAGAAHGMPRVVITSSIGALGFSNPTHPCLPDYLPIDIAHPQRPQDIYGLSKQMNELSAAAITRLTGMTTIVIRPPLVLDSANNSGRIGRMMESWTGQLQKDFWSFIEVRDLAVAFRLAVESEITGNHVFYAMADDVLAAVPVNELIERHLPQLAGDLPKLTGKGCYDLTPARDILGFTAKRLAKDLLEG